MKRWKGLKYALEWIAYNDEPDDMNPETISEYISVMLIADCTGHKAIDLGHSIMNIRKPSSPQGQGEKRERK